MYRITTTKKIAGVALSVPIVTLESKPKAIEAMECAIKDAESELNQSHVRLVGGQIDITLEECAHTIGGSSDAIAHATIKRPENSKKAEVFKDGL